MKTTIDASAPETRPLKSRARYCLRRVPFSGTPPPGPGAPAISVVVPLKNESPNVLPLARRVFEALASQPGSIELIFVDDASTDDTWARIQEAKREDQRVRALQHLRPGGQSAALWTGFEAARGEVLATLDGDLQNDPADLPRMLAELERCDLVCGVRTQRMDSGLRRLSSWIARGARKAAFKADFRDIGCNLRAFKRPVLQTLLPFDGLHRFLPLLAQDAGAVVKELPVAHHPRTAGRSKYGVWNRLGRGLWDLTAMAWYRKRHLPELPVVEHMAEPGRQP